MKASVDNGGVSRAAVEAVVTDLERCLCQDRAHAVAVAPASATELLLERLEQRLAGRLRAVRVSPWQGGEEPCSKLLLALGLEPGCDAEEQLLALARELARDESALVLLLRQPSLMPPSTLRHLGRLAAATRPGLRLALFVSDERSDGAIAGVVSTLGVGAEKIVLHALPERPERGAVERPRPQRSAPPLRVVAPRSSRPPAVPAIPRAAMGLAIAIAAFAVYGAALQERPPPVSARGEAMTAKLEAPATASIAPTEAPRPILVNLNASPWARISVDGRHVGVTPLAKLPLAPGPHRFLARFPDGRVLERVERIDAHRDRITFP